MSGIEATDRAELTAGAGRRTYIAIGVLLAAITLVEWQLPTLFHDARSVLIVSLVILSALKAGLVMAFYMHLKSDSRVYTAVLVLGAILVGYFLVLATLRFIWPY